MSQNIYYVMHVLGIVLLTAFTFQAFANPDPAKKKMTMILTGLCTVAILVGGFGLKAKVGIEGWPGWLIAKMGIWFVLSGMSGMAYRGAGLIGVLRIVSIVLVGAGIYLVYNKPF